MGHAVGEKPVRRVVTGHDAGGRSRVASDEKIEPITTALRPGFAAYPLWGREEPPTFPDAGSPDRAPSWFPPRAGTRFMIITQPPEGQATPADVDIATAAEKLEREMPGVAASMDTDGSGMHSTATMDYLLVVRGEATLELDDGASVVLSAGDVIVQNGIRHAWRNYGTEPLTMVAVAVGADHSAGHQLDRASRTEGAER